MQTLYFIAAQFDGAALIDADRVRAEYFSHYSAARFGRALDSGEVPLPVVRTGSQKSKRMIPIADLASYLDEQMAVARRELARKVA